MSLLLSCICLAMTAGQAVPRSSQEPAAVAAPRRVRVEVTVASLNPEAVRDFKLGPQDTALSLADGQRVLGLLKQAQKKETAKIVAQTAVVTASGRTGRDQNGISMPVLVRDENGQGHIEYVVAETGLVVLPTIWSAGKHESIHVEMNVQFLSNPKAKPGDSGFSQRAWATAMVLQDGQTVQINAGGMSLTTSDTTKVPVLGDLPLVGTLFRTVRERRIEETYMILVTAHIIDPATVRDQ